MRHAVAFVRRMRTSMKSWVLELRNKDIQGFFPEYSFHLNEVLSIRAQEFAQLVDVCGHLLYTSMKSWVLELRNHPNHQDHNQYPQDLNEVLSIRAQE